MGRIMALDVGERTIGIALSDPGHCIASPHSTIRRQALDTDLAVLKELVDQQEVEEVVVGLPRSLSGELHFQAEKTLRFVKELQTSLSIPIKTWDERLSTVEASRMLTSANVRQSRQKQIIDQTAAAVILQGYLAARSFQR